MTGRSIHLGILWVNSSTNEVKYVISIQKHDDGNISKVKGRQQEL